MRKTKKSKQNHNNTFNILRIHATLYQNYTLLYCKGHIYITSNNRNINVQTKTNIVNKITTTDSVCPKSYKAIAIK